MKPKMKLIIKDVCEYWGVEFSEIYQAERVGLSKSQRLFVSMAVFEICVRAFAAGYSMSEIGRTLNRNHATVHYWLRRSSKHYERSKRRLDVLARMRDNEGSGADHIAHTGVEPYEGE